MYSWRVRKLVAAILLGFFIFSCFTTWASQFMSNTEVQPEWERMKGMRLWDLVLPLEETSIVAPHDIKTSPLVVIFVSSSPSSYQRRSQIRKTWAKNSKDKGVLVLFFVGTDMTPSKTVGVDTDKHVLREFKRYKDIIQDTILEDQFQETVKVLRIMKYYLQVFVDNKKEGSGVPLFIKVNEDVEINLDHLMSPKMLRQLGYNSKSGTFQGRILGGTRVLTKSIVVPDRNTSSRYYMPYSVYAKNVYPPFVHEMFYAISSSDFVKEIYVRSINLLYFPFENIFISGIVANYLCRANVIDLNEVHNGHISDAGVHDVDTIVAYRIIIKRFTNSTS